MGGGAERTDVTRYGLFFHDCIHLFFTVPFSRLRSVVEAVAVPCALPATVAKEFGEEAGLGPWARQIRLHHHLL